MADFYTVPKPKDQSEANRWNEGARRERLAKGYWAEDLHQRMQLHFGLTRAGVVGPRSLAKNSIKRIADELAVLYLDTPKVRHGELGEVLGLLGPDGLMAMSGIWPSMRRFQSDTLIYRENLIRVDWSPETGLLYRFIPPHRVIASSSCDNPGTPTKICELRYRWEIGQGCWTWEVCDVSDPLNPSFRVHKDDAGDLGEDLTEAVYGAGFSGDAYPYRKADGAPVLPYVLYHAEMAQQLFAPYDWTELVDATLDLAVCANFWLHAAFQASWPQRYTVNARVESAGVQYAGGLSASVVADPTSLLHLASEPGVNANVGQWGASIDLLMLQNATSAFERSVMQVAGIDAANIVRESADAWSGAALSISRDGKREAQKIYTPQFRAADLKMIELSAIIANRLGGFAFPESGYRIDYVSIPLSPQELESKRKHHSELLAAGRMALSEAYQEEHPGTTRDEAVGALIAIASEAKMIEEEKAAILGEDSVVSTALNGAQVQAVVQVVSAVAAGQLPRDSGVAIVAAALAISGESAELIVGSAGLERPVAQPPPTAQEGESVDIPEEPETSDAMEENDPPTEEEEANGL